MLVCGFRKLISKNLGRKQTIDPELIMLRLYEEEFGRADSGDQLGFKGVTRQELRLANTMILPAIRKIKNILN
jgi:hypothetical protein